MWSITKPLTLRRYEDAEVVFMGWTRTGCVMASSSLLYSCNIPQQHPCSSEHLVIGSAPFICMPSLS